MSPKKHAKTLISEVTCKTHVCTQDVIVTEACHHFPARRFGPHEVRDCRVVAEGQQDSQAGDTDQQHPELGHKCSLQSWCVCVYMFVGCTTPPTSDKNMMSLENIKLLTASQIQNLD